jgi:hypothetical protein
MSASARGSRLSEGIVLLLLLDLFVLHRGAHEVSARNALWSTVGFVGVAVLFGIGLGVAEGDDIAAQYFTGYLLEFEDVPVAVELRGGGPGVRLRRS